MLPLAHLDREFDYLVPRELEADAQPGVRVRIRFAGRLVDGFIVSREATSDHQGKFGWLERVISSERVLTAEIAQVVDRVAERYAGTRADVLRLAVPPRHAKVEAEPWEPAEPPSAPEPIENGWHLYRFGDAFLSAIRESKSPRAVWQALPGENWPLRLAELAGAVAASGKSAILVVPDQRDLDRVVAACTELSGADAVVGLSAGLGPAMRYRRWLAALRGPPGSSSAHGVLFLRRRPRPVLSSSGTTATTTCPSRGRRIHMPAKLPSCVATSPGAPS